MPHHRVTWSGATSPARRANGTPPGDADGNATGTRAAEDVGPYHAPPPCRLVGRDVPGAPRQRNAPGDANGNATCTRAAEDVGPYHTPVPATAHSAVRVSTLPRTTTPRAASATSTLGSTFTPGAHR